MRGALREAAQGVMKEPTLHSIVKGHADAESAIEALLARAPQGGQTQLPRAVEEALAALVLKLWQTGNTVEPEALMEMAYLEAKKANRPFKVSTAA